MEDVLIAIGLLPWYTQAALTILVLYVSTLVVLHVKQIALSVGGLIDKVKGSPPSVDPGAGLDPVSQDVVSTAMFHKALKTMELMVDSCSEPAVFIDPDGVIRAVNDSLEKVSGYSRAELIGASTNVLMPQNVANLHEHYIRAYLERRDDKLATRIIGKERPIHFKTKDDVLMSSTLLVTHFDNGVKGFMGTFKRVVPYVPVQELLLPTVGHGPTAMPVS